MKPFIFLLFLGTATTFVFQTCDGFCDPMEMNFPPMDSLDMSRLVKKTWYIQEIFVAEPGNSSTVPPIECMAQTVGYYNPDHPFVTHDITESYTYLNTGETQEDLLIGGPMFNKSSVWFLGDLFATLFYTTLWVDTDHENYGVTHWCPHENIDWAYEHVQIFTGVPNPDEAVLSQLRGKVAAMGFPIDVAVHIPHHADCKYQTGGGNP